MTRWTLGISHTLHESAACLLHDDELIFASAEERLSRLKHDSSFPIRAIHAALAHADIRAKDITAVGISMPNALRGIKHDIKGLAGGSVPLNRWHILSPLYHYVNTRGSHSTEVLVQQSFSDNSDLLVHQAGHHVSHAWSASMMAPSDRVAIVVADGRGAKNSTSIWIRDGASLSLRDAKTFPDSLGLFYAKITQYLGFQPFSDEWKVMGLAPFGSPGVDMKQLIRVSGDDYSVNGRVLLGKGAHDLSSLEHLFGPSRNPDGPIDDRHRDVAFAAQDAVERAMLAITRRAIRLTGARSLALAGGVALNCKANGLVQASGDVDDLLIQPAAGDDGASLGSAIDAYHLSGGTGVPDALTNASLGQALTDERIEAALRGYKVVYTRVEDPAKAAADRLARSEVVGWFQGRAEFGPRALGNRSILADPRDVRMRDKVNAAVKYRELWRPFAPSVLAEFASDMFEGCRESPFMIVTFRATERARKEIPAVVHVDGTSRVQTVTKEANPLYERLLRRFYKLTGVPAIMNTSFNLKGDPIVNDVRDAVQTFFSSGLDSLVIGSFCLDKRQQGSNLGDEARI